MGLEILGYTMCRVDYDGCWAYRLKYLNWYLSGWRGLEAPTWSYFLVFYGKDAIYTIDYSEIVWLVLYCVQDVIDNIGAW